MIRHLVVCAAFAFWSHLTFAAGPVLSEFVALNQSSLRDADGDSSDWIEIVNGSDVATNLAGWHLTDEAARPGKWTFPSTPLGPGGFLVVFASGKDRTVAGQELHTNFRLNNEGEYLALTRPDNSIASEFAPSFPPQGPDIAYGTSLSAITSLNPVLEGAACRYLVPTNAVLGDTWTRPGFDSSSWLSGAAPLGFDTGGVFRSYADEILADDPVYYWNFDEPSGPALNWVNPGVVQDSLTAQGSAVRVTQSSLPLGRAASFPGSDGSRFYAANLSAGVDLAGPWAVEFWVRNLSLTKPTYFLEGGSTSGALNTPGLIQGYNGAHLEIYGAGGRTGVDGPTLNDTLWHHLLFGYFGSAAGEGVANRHDFYIDGARVSSQLSDFPVAIPLAAADWLWAARRRGRGSAS